ncbi:TPA: phage tail assembly protein T [Proteus mirabilis]|nr:phage tail assembly protein T [Proteus mirabilis]HEK1048719.1 phage tail assembly protein T [Proteus mirabilis]HEK2593255.1 phage tail assembly protein T [Proteus mirabilis]
MLRLSHEFKRADWRRMLSEMTATELADWLHFFNETPFTLQLIDHAFSGLNFTVASVFGGGKDLSPEDFSVLLRKPAVDMDDEIMMAVSEGIAGGIRYEPTNSGSHD